MTAGASAPTLTRPPPVATGDCSACPSVRPGFAEDSGYGARRGRAPSSCFWFPRPPEELCVPALSLPELRSLANGGPARVGLLPIRTNGIPQQDDLEIQIPLDKSHDGCPDDALLAEPDCRLTFGLDHRDAQATVVDRGDLVETMTTLGVMLGNHRLTAELMLSCGPASGPVVVTAPEFVHRFRRAAVHAPQFLQPAEARHGHDLARVGFLLSALRVTVQAEQTDQGLEREPLEYQGREDDSERGEDDEPTPWER